MTSMNAQLEGNLFVEKVLGGDHELRFGVEYNNIDTVSDTLSPNQRVGYFKWYGDFTSSYGIWLRPDNKIDTGFDAHVGLPLGHGDLQAPDPEPRPAL